jgi:hypothetical protein
MVRWCMPASQPVYERIVSYCALLQEADATAYGTGRGIAITNSVETIIWKYAIVGVGEPSKGAKSLGVAALSTTSIKYR